MAKTIHIENRTNSFISHYNRLRALGQISNDKELLSVLGIKSVSTITEIKKKRQNITPDQWQSFQNHFHITEYSEKLCADEPKIQAVNWEQEYIKLQDKFTDVIKEKESLELRIKKLETQVAVDHKSRLWAVEQFLSSFYAKILPDTTQQEALSILSKTVKAHRQNSLHTYNPFEENESKKNKAMNKNGAD